MGFVMVNALREIDSAEWFCKHTQLFMDQVSAEDGTYFIEEKQDYTEMVII